MIDACAGSGVLQLPSGKLTKGSPLILEELVRDKGECICIDVNENTCDLLAKHIKKSEIIKGNCNEVLPDLATGEKPTLVYIDPFGYGVPAIDKKMVLGLAQISNTDLLIHFSWRICREMGYARRYLNCEIADCPSPSDVGSKVASCDDCKNRKVATSYAKSLDIWWGTVDWANWVFRGKKKAEKYAYIYAEPLRRNNKVQVLPINHSFHLIFATKFQTPKMGFLEDFFNG